MPKLFIPKIGTILILSRQWKFFLYNEERNSSIMSLVGLHPSLQSEDVRWLVLPIGTKIKVDRIYIRQNYEDFDSVTFRLIALPDELPVHGVRFWAKLQEVNDIEYEIEEPINRVSFSTRPMTDNQKQLFDQIVTRNLHGKNPFGYPEYQDPSLKGRINRMMDRGWLEKRDRRIPWHQRQTQNWYYNYAVYPTIAGTSARSQ